MKIVIVIEDKFNGNVSIQSNPTGEILAKKIQSGENLSSAEGYALRMLNEARKISKDPSGSMKIQLPKLVS